MLSLNETLSLCKSAHKMCENFALKTGSFLKVLEGALQISSDGKKHRRAHPFCENEIKGTHLKKEDRHEKDEEELM